MTYKIIGLIQFIIGFLCLDIVLAKERPFFNIVKFDSVKLYDCDQTEKKIRGIYDLKSREKVFNVNADADRPLVLIPAFKNNPKLFRFFIVCRKSDSSGLLIVSSVHDGIFETDGAKVKVVDLSVDKQMTSEIEDFLKQSDEGATQNHGKQSRSKRSTGGH